MVFPTAAVLEIPEQLREVCMQPSRLKNSAGDAAGPFGAQRQRRQAWIDMIASGVLLCQVGAAPETPLRGKLSEISLDEESVEENVVTMQAMSRRAQSVAAEGRDTVALLVNTGAGKLCLAQRGRTADLAVGDAALRDNAKPWKLVGEPNYVCRALCIQVPRELVRPHVEDHAAVTIPAGSPALALARNYVEGLLSVGGFDDAGLARLALDHLADLVSAALTGTAGEIAAQSVDNSGAAPLRRPNDIAYPLAALSRVDSHAMISAATLDVMAMPILVLDAEGHCIDTNAAADRLLATTRLIRISGGVLVIADQDASRQVAHAVRAAAAGADPVSTRVTVVALTLEESRRYAAEVIALPRAAPSDGIAALMLQEIGKLQPLPGDILVKLYGFTPAEARLVALLAQDFSLEDAAAALGIARTTAKTHLQRVFEKTGTNRQPQVVRLALSAFAAAPT